MYKTKFYMMYRWCWSRCNAPYATHYYRYWGRGVKCLWQSFGDFKNDMYDLYNKAVERYWEQPLSIDRINIDWHYCKENCVFIPKTENSKKTRRTYELVVDWNVMSWVEVSKHLWINENTIRTRKMRWLNITHVGKIPDKRGTTIPHYNRHKEIFWDKARTYHCIYRRIHIDGWDIEKAINTR